MFIGANGGQNAKIADDFYVVTNERSFVHAQGVLQQLSHCDVFEHTGNLRVALLHGNDLIDMLDVSPKGSQFGKHFCLFGVKLVRKVADEVGNLSAFGIIGEKGCAVAGVVLE